MQSAVNAAIRKNADVNLNDSNHASFNDEDDDSDSEWQA
jgi:hypothetical protein